MSKRTSEDMHKYHRRLLAAMHPEIKKRYRTCPITRMCAEQAVIGGTGYVAFLENLVLALGSAHEQGLRDLWQARKSNTRIALESESRDQSGPEPVGVADLDLPELKDDLAKLDGRSPYDEPGNHCRNDSYFARSLEKKYGRSIKELRQLVKGH